MKHLFYCSVYFILFDTRRQLKTLTSNPFTVIILGKTLFFGANHQRIFCSNKSRLSQAEYHRTNSIKSLKIAWDWVKVLRPTRLTNVVWPSQHSQFLSCAQLLSRRPNS